VSIDIKIESDIALRELNDHRTKLNTYFEDLLGHKMTLNDQIQKVEQDTQNEINDLNTQDEK